jgi:hypothetical protein
MHPLGRRRTRSVGQRADHVQHLDDGTRPAVGDDERQSVLLGRPHVDEVDVEAVDLGQELREGVEPRFEPPEVVFVGPVPDELTHRGQRHPLREVGDGLLLGPAGSQEPAAKIVDGILRDVDIERADRFVPAANGRRRTRQRERHGDAPSSWSPARSTAGALTRITIVLPAVRRARWSHLESRWTGPGAPLDLKLTPQELQIAKA